MKTITLPFYISVLKCPPEHPALAIVFSTSFHWYLEDAICADLGMEAMLLFLCPGSSLLFFVAVINNMTESSLGRKGLFHFLLYGPTSREAKMGPEGRNLKAGTKSETTEKHCLLT